MPVYELILSSDTINEGRIKINNAFSATTGLWSGSTGVQSLIHNNDSGNIAGGDYSIVTGYNNSADSNSPLAIIMGSGSTISGDAFPYITLGGSIIGGYDSVIHRGSSSGIFCGYLNSISGSSGVFDFSNGSVIVGGQGQSNVVSILNSNYSFLGAGYKNYIHRSAYASIVGGREHFISGTSTYASIVGGFQNNILFGSGGIFGGEKSYLNDSYRAAIVGGEFNSITSNGGPTGTFNCAILGGGGNQIINDLPSPSEGSVIIGGGSHIIYGATNHSAILGGFDIYLNEGYSASIGGYQSYLQAPYASIIAGRNHFINAVGSYSVVLGGYKNDITNTNCIIAGTGSATRSGYTFVMGYGGAAPVGSSSTNNTIALEFTNGSIYYEGGLYNSTADYAEYFEWDDGNSLNEDRTGYFVSLVGEKIEIGNSNIVGVISAKPGIAGDSAPLVWNRQFLTDEFGRVEKEKYSVYTIEIEKEEREGEEVRVVKETKEIYIDSKNNIYSEQPYTTNMLGVLYDGDTSNKKFIREEYLNKLNPSFDINQTYVPREKRPEWSPVGLLGKLYVRTSEAITGNKISVDANGMAINGTDYHVLKETKAYDGNYGIVQILFK